ncbi:hypothetical protein EW146_g342 [Bondarzewia mesenterica]|uniref:Replication factor A protein 3 n=1 Tax=Bondarzewia mesenterica TaxID=1095465 RepID=A0A4S4M9H3_9AGAM|nr:hypothetical protein EW146_g342 [Bondarzewia mesenterica]
MAEHISTRVNSHHLASFVGHPVRIVGKILKFQDDIAIMEACDGGQVEIRLPRAEAEMTDTFVEVIGTVVDASTVKMMACTNMGSTLDMKLIKDVVDLTHDPKFAKRIF